MATTMPSVRAIQCMQTYHLTPSELHYKMLNEWNIHFQTSDESQALKAYYMLFWAPIYFFDKLCDGIIERQGIGYHVVYHKCKPEELKKESQIILSFREAQTIFGIPAYVLISLMKDY